PHRLYGCTSTRVLLTWPPTTAWPAPPRDRPTARSCRAAAGSAAAQRPAEQRRRGRTGCCRAAQTTAPPAAPLHRRQREVEREDDGKGAAPLSCCWRSARRTSWRCSRRVSRGRSSSGRRVRRLDVKAPDTFVYESASSTPDSNETPPNT